MELPLSLQSIYITLNGLFTTDMNHFIAPLSIMIKKRKADSQSKNCLLQLKFVITKIHLIMFFNILKYLFIILWFFIPANTYYYNSNNNDCSSYLWRCVWWWFWWWRFLYFLKPWSSVCSAHFYVGYFSFGKEPKANFPIK